MEIELTEKDLKEIENKYWDLTAWLTSNFASFSACAFILQTIMDAVDEAKKEMKNNE